MGAGAGGRDWQVGAGVALWLGETGRWELARLAETGRWELVVAVVAVVLWCQSRRVEWRLCCCCCCCCS